MNWWSERTKPTNRDDGHSDDGPAEETVEIHHVTVIRETELALCCRGESGKDRWVPKSVVHDDSYVWKTGNSGTLLVKRWWAEKNGFV